MMAKYWLGNGLQPWVRTALAVVAAGTTAIALPTAARTEVDRAATPPLESGLETGQTSPSLLQAGQQFYESGQLDRAAALWQQALREAQSQGDVLRQGLSWNYLAIVYRDLNRLDRADAAIETSLQLLAPTATAHSEPTLQTAYANALITAGSLQLQQGQAETALETWLAAEAAYQELADVLGQVGAKINQTQALQVLGFYRRARLLLESIQTDLEPLADSELKALALQNLGVNQQAIGRYGRSRRALEESLRISRSLGSPALSSAVLVNLGNTLRLQADLPAAVRAYQEAVALSPTTLGRLEARLELLRLQIRAGQWPAARRTLAAIRTQLPALSPSRPTVYAQIDLATQLQQLLTGEATAARSAFPDLSPETVAAVLARAVGQARHLGDRRSESYGLGQLGHLYEREGQWDAALEMTQQALLLAEDLGANEIAYRWHWQLGRLYRQSPAITAGEQRERAIAAYGSAIENLQSVRADLLALASEVQFSFRDSVEPLYREYAGLLISADSTPQELRQAVAAIEDLQLAELEDYFRSACLDTNLSPVDVLASDAAVIYPLLLSDRIEVIVSIPQQPLQHHTVAIPAVEARAVLADLFQSLNPAFSDRQRLQLSQQVHDWLLGPVRDRLQASGVQTLVYVPDVEFRNIPLSALHDGRRYLLEAFNIALTPGLQLIQASQQSEESQALTLGLSEARQGFSALPGVKRELAAIQERLPAIALLNQEFTSTELERRIGSADSDILHLATHGQFSSNPERTFLLAWDERVSIDELGQWLKARNASRLTPFDLLILSACQTAAGDNRAALGLAGLAVQSGATSTIATLWGVNDESTAELMQTLYAFLARDEEFSKGESLRQAQLALLQNPKYQHPYHWAPFVLVGNWE